MSLSISKPAIDIGIITRNPEPMFNFYHEQLGLPLEAVIDMPGGGTMRRLRVGDSVIKIIDIVPEPASDVEPGGIRAATGYRYWTIHIDNLDAVLARASQQKIPVVVPKKTVRPGVTIAFLEDPDGNWVELLEQG